MRLLTRGPAERFFGVWRSRRMHHRTARRRNVTCHGFAFLTFEDPASVNAVMIREHPLDGKVVRVPPI